MTEDNLKKMLTVSEENTAMLSISVVSNNAEFAAKVANEIAKVFTEESHSIFNITNVNIIDVAEVEDTPYNVNHIKDLMIFILLGGFISCGFVLMLYLLDTTIKEEKDIEQELKLPFLGIIPTYAKNLEKDSRESGKNKEKHILEENRKLSKKNINKVDELVILKNTKSPVSEAFRTLRTNITFSANTKTILITSSRMSEGKSYVTANLATAIAKTDKKVIVIDADMRKGRQNRIFKVSNKSGLSDYLANCDDKSSDINEIVPYIKTTEIPNLHIITSGTRPSNPAELLIPDKIQGLLLSLEKIYDIILLDGSPSSIISDSLSIAKFVDYTLLVTSYKFTKIEEAKRVIKNFEQVGGKIKGAILNKYPLTKEEYTTSYYYDYEKSVPKLEDISEKVKSVEEFLQEANINKVSKIENIMQEKNIDLDVIKEVSKVNSQISNYSLEHKVDKIDAELSAMKNILMKIAINNNQINSKDIELIRNDIKALKESIEEVKDSKNAEFLRKEIETTRNLAESLVQTQQDNNEKVRRFIENYYRDKNKRERNLKN